ncbi:uncharacterized protein [Anabrus simplex]|uniref:uncharacterized protein n=1 Tax=Anabrus simplex TaxID=316456 RepID=UPI0035A2B52A
MEEKANNTVTENVQPKSDLSTKIFIATKLTELVLAIFSIGLIVDPFRHMRETDVNHAGLTYVAYSGCIVANCIFLLARLAREQQPLRVMLLFTLVHGVLLIAAGGVVLADWVRFRTRIVLLQPKQYMDMMVASGVMAIFNGVTHFIDIALTIKFS